MPEYGDVPDEILEDLRSICMSLPDAYEEPAWTGTRWRVRQRTFAHVLALASGSANAHARAAGRDGDVVVLTFKANAAELDALRNSGPPFFYAGWGRDVVGMTLESNVDWAEVRELLIESYCTLAPKKLVALVDRPPPQDPRDS